MLKQRAVRASLSTILKCKPISSFHLSLSNYKYRYYSDKTKTFGLCIHHSETSEPNNVIEKSDSLITETTNTVQTLQNEINNIDWYNDKELISTYKLSVDQIHQDLIKINSSLRHRYSFLPPIEGAIQNFSFDFRGLLLTIRYTMDNAITSIRNKIDKIEKHTRMMHVLRALTQMGTILVEERQRAVDNCVKRHPEIDIRNAVSFPYSDSIDIHEYEQFKTLNASDYFEEIGQQFAPMMRLFLGLMVSVTASHNASLGYHPLFRRGIFYASNLYYLLNAREAAQKTNEFMATLTTSAGKDLWTMPDTNKFVRTLSFLSMPDIEISATFSIPFHVDPTTSLQTQQQLKEQDQHVSEHLKKKPVDATEPNAEMIGESTLDEVDYYNNQIVKLIASSENVKKEIQIRIISANPLPESEKSNELKRDYPSLTTIRHTFSNTRKQIKDLLTWTSSNKQNRPGFIFHVHGGGFIALSSFAHECYLRPWAIETQLPIFSVDYSKTPDYHYPVQLEECYQAYQWILENGQALGIDTQKNRLCR